MIILHGDNPVASRSELSKLKQSASLLELAGDTLDLATLVQSCSAVDLFGQSSLVIIEGLFSRRPSTAKKHLLDYLSTHPTLNVVIWEPKDVSLQLKSFPPSILKKFALPPHIFTFLDTLSLPHLQLALAATPPELLLNLLAGHVHKLLLVSSGISTFPPWQLSKLTSLVRKLSHPKLLVLQSALMEIDFRHKTGNSPSSLAQSLEVLIATL